jgi:SAM-dependent methyltransferase
VDPPAPAREKWNLRYAAEPGFAPFPDAPAEWLVENRALLGEVRGRALDVACGDGRNSRYLAEALGFPVEAIDVSDVAVDALRAAASARGLDVEARRVDLEAEAPPPGPYAVIVEVNFLQRDLFAALAGALGPGGLLVFETFVDAGEPDQRLDPRFLLAPNELLHAFPGLLVRHYREGVAVRGGRPQAVASLVAQRPPAA